MPTKTTIIGVIVALVIVTAIATTFSVLIQQEQPKPLETMETKDTLQAVSLDLGTVVIGAFVDSEVREIMNMQEQESPLYIMPVGRKG